LKGNHHKHCIKNHLHADSESVGFSTISQFKSRHALDAAILDISDTSKKMCNKPEVLIYYGY